MENKGFIAQPDKKKENTESQIDEPQIGEPVMIAIAFPPDPIENAEPQDREPFPGAIALPPDLVYQNQTEVTQIKTYVERQNQLIEQQ